VTGFSILAMDDTDTAADARRHWMQHLALAALTTQALAAQAAEPPATSAPHAPPASPRGRGTPGEFDFLTGQWRIANRRRLPDGRWDEYPGEATCWSILGGVISIEELRIPARRFSGMGLRALDLDKGLWSDYWVNAQSGVIGAAGLVGGFEAGVGRFDAEDEEDGKPVRYRGQWDRITARSCRWQQMSSLDGGASWDVSWTMDWMRA
jgi:hypothetical protein